MATLCYSTTVYHLESVFWKCFSNLMQTLALSCPWGNNTECQVFAVTDFHCKIPSKASKSQNANLHNIQSFISPSVNPRRPENDERLDCAKEWELKGPAPEGLVIKKKWKAHWRGPPVEWKVCPENTQSHLLFEQIKLIKQFAQRRC